MRDTKWYHFLTDWYYDLEWFFAKRWLNRTFGYKEYWGDYIESRIWEERARKNPKPPTT